MQSTTPTHTGDFEGDVVRADRLQVIYIYSNNSIHITALLNDYYIVIENRKLTHFVDVQQREIHP